MYHILNEGLALQFFTNVGVQAALKLVQPDHADKRHKTRNSQQNSPSAKHFAMAVPDKAMSRHGSVLGDNIVP